MLTSNKKKNFISDTSSTPKNNTLSDFFESVKPELVSLAVGLFLLAGYFLVRSDKSLANFFINHITTPYKRMMGWLCDLVPFSMMEVIIVFLILLALFVLIRGVFLAVMRPKKAARIGKTIGFFLVAALLIWDGYNWFWGINYYGDSFSDLSGLSAQPISVEDLTQTTEYYANELNCLADKVSRDENGCFNENMDEFFSQSDNIYAGLIEEYSFLDIPHRTPKRMIFSELMSRINFTGVYFPFTSETNLNDHAPASLMPSTIAHELAHQRGIAAEQEANFVAVRACMTSGIDTYAYSGALLAYIHLGNALYDADRSAWESVYNSLDDNVIADLNQNNAYWAEYKGSESKTAEKIYETFLGSYGQTMGMKSYGACVDLLTADYLQRVNQQNSSLLSDADGIS